MQIFIAKKASVSQNFIWRFLINCTHPWLSPFQERETLMFSLLLRKHYLTNKPNRMESQKDRRFVTCNSKSMKCTKSKDSIQNSNTSYLGTIKVFIGKNIYNPEKREQNAD